MMYIACVTSPVLFVMEEASYLDESTCLTHYIVSLLVDELRRADNKRTMGMAIGVAVI